MLCNIVSLQLRVISVFAETILECAFLILCTFFTSRLVVKVQN